MKSQSVKEITNALEDNKTLQSLVLSGSSGISAIADALKGANSSLLEIDLSYVRIKQTGAARLADALKVNSSLQKLGLSNNAIGDAAVSLLADALKVNSSLRQLKLDSNDIGDAGVQAIAATLSETEASSLVEIDLRRNKFGDAGAVALAEALKVNRSIQKMHLSENSINESGILAIEEAMGENTSLTELWLDYMNSRLSVRSVEAIAQAIKSNPNIALRVLRIGNKANAYGDDDDEDTINDAKKCAMALADAVKRNCTLKEVALSNSIASELCISIIKAAAVERPQGAPALKVRMARHWL